MTVTPSDWKRLPFEDMVAIPYRADFSQEQFEKLSAGLLPRAMEDKWFVYLDDNELCFHRSWTGQGIYKIMIAQDGEIYAVTNALCSTKMLEASDREYQSELLDFLICNLLLGETKPFPRPAGITEQLPGVYQHAISGTGYREKIVAKKPWWKLWT
ncbi:hypothetical protein [Novosphingobium sp. 9]|uniref:hypothetical protein n=1 Tax=Novosphingobium sp. 9 TaxID=2025349 RepID=UPI0021B4DE28|nr:hypothetical protein [Novosphingobium sp. 9]